MNLRRKRAKLVVMPKPKQVFISHASEDREYVEREVVSWLTDHGISVWFSPHHIQSATHFNRSIQAGLAECDWFLVVLSPRSVASRWVEAEVHWAMDKRQDRIVPVLAEDCDWEDLHLMLRTIHYVDFRRDLDDGKRRLLNTWAEAARERDLTVLVEEGIAAVGLELNQLKSPGNDISARGIGKVFDTAIRHGAPIYNHGSPDGCATVYAHAARGIPSMLDQAAVPVGGALSEVFHALSRTLDSIFDEFPSATGPQADRLAWKLRAVFDHFEVARGIEDVERLLEELRQSEAALTLESVSQVIGVAIAHGNVLYKAQDLQGCAELHLHTARGTLDLIGESVDASGNGAPITLRRVRDELAPIVSARDLATAENGAELAWALYEAFLHILEFTHSTA